LPKQKFLVVKVLKSLIDQEKEKKRTNPEYQLNTFKERLGEIEKMHKNAEEAMSEKYFEIRDGINLDRDNFKQEIDKLADDLIKRMDLCEKESKSDSEYLSGLINEMKFQLSKYERFLIALEKTDEDRRAKSQEIGEAIVNLDDAIKEFSSKSINNRSLSCELMNDEIKILYGRLIVS
jgi:hypothetical protein